MNNKDDNIQKWFTESEYVDIETGEIIKKYQVETKEYYITNKSLKYEFDEIRKIGIRKYINECRTTGQTKLF